MAHLHLDLLKKAKLNIFIFFTPNLPPSFYWHNLFQLTQLIDLFS